MKLRRVPSEVARQALVNQVLGWPEVADAEVVDRDPADLEVIASQVAVPELLPYEYVYVNIYADEGGTYYAEIDRQSRMARRRAPRTVPY